MALHDFTLHVLLFKSWMDRPTMHDYDELKLIKSRSTASARLFAYAHWLQTDTKPLGQKSRSKVKWFNWESTNKQTDGRTLQSTLSPHFAVDRTGWLLAWLGRVDWRVELLVPWRHVRAEKYFFGHISSILKGRNEKMMQNNVHYGVGYKVLYRLGVDSLKKEGWNVWKGKGWYDLKSGR